VAIAAGATMIVALVAFVFVGAPFNSPRLTTLRPADTQVTALGQQLYSAHCAACHGTRLEGQTNWRQRDAQGRLPAPPHDATGHTWHHPDDLLFRITKFGVAKAANLQSYDSSMPAYESVLTDAEIVAVLSWIKAQWPEDLRAKHDEMNRSATQRR
jgi:mono/diheme cytochrome c family protein